MAAIPLQYNVGIIQRVNELADTGISNVSECVNSIVQGFKVVLTFLSDDRKLFERSTIMSEALNQIGVGLSIGQN